MLLFWKSVYKGFSSVYNQENTKNAIKTRFLQILPDSFTVSQELAIYHQEQVYLSDSF